MFKEISRDDLTAAEIKKRIFAYTYCQPEPQSSSVQNWQGSIDTYTLNLRLSGIYGEKLVTSNWFCERDYQTNSRKYLYLASAIFIQETEELKQPEFIRLVYQVFLGREVDPGGLATNLQQLQTGALRINVVNAIRNSEEAQSFFLNLTDCLSDQAFQQLLRRIYLYLYDYDLDLPGESVSDQGEISRSQLLQDWQRFYKLQGVVAERGQDFGIADSNVLSSREQLTDEDFVRQLYLIYLKREADSEGLQSQVAQLASGTSRSQVLVNLRTSHEAINLFVNLTADLENFSFIEIAYCLYHRLKVSSAQKQLDLEKLESGNRRHTILVTCAVEPMNNQHDSRSHPELPNPELDSKRTINNRDRQLLYQQWQVGNSEFLQGTKHLKNEEFINQLYQFFLQRSVDQQELAWHQQQLSHNSSRLDLLDFVRRSQEAAHLLIEVTQDLNHQQFLDLAYRIYFHQELDSKDRVVYLQFLERGNPRIDLLD